MLVTSEDLTCFSLPTVVKAEWLECRKTQRSGPERPGGDTEVVDPSGFGWPTCRYVWLQLAQMNFLQFKVQDCITLTDYSPLGPKFRINLLTPSSGQNTEAAHHPKGWYLSTPNQLTAISYVLKLNEIYRSILRNHLQHGKSFKE